MANLSGKVAVVLGAAGEANMGQHIAQALADEAYALEDAYVGPRGLSWLHRWALTRGMELKEEPREPEWLARLVGADPQ